MTTQTENCCFRGRDDCVPLANLSADGPGPDGAAPASFVCVGLNSMATRPIPQDRFTMCWKSGVVDERGAWDKRDLMDTMSVISQALSTDENMRVNMGVEECDLQTTNFLA